MQTSLRIIGFLISLEISIAASGQSGAELNVGGGISATLTNLGQVHALSLEEGAKGIPVKVRATLTYSDPEWQMMFIQDDTGAVCLKHHAPPGDPSWKFLPGQIVEIEGFTKKGPVHCDVVEKAFRALGPGPLPSPMELDSEESFSITNDWHWARTSGFILGPADYHGPRSSLRLAVRRGKSVVPLKLWLVNANEALVQSLQGGVVEVTGVFGFVLDANQHLTSGNELWISDPSSIRKVRSVPALSIADLLALKNGRLPEGPVKLRGNVVSQSPGEFLFVRDDSGTIRVDVEGPESYGAGSPIIVYGRPFYQDNMLVLKEVLILTLDCAPAANTAPKVQKNLPATANTNLAELTQVAQIRSLSAAEAARGHPVRVTGVLTYKDANGTTQFIQDDSAGIFVDIKNKKFDAFPDARQVVEITGFSGPGDYAPVIEAEHVRVLGESAFPAPKFRTSQVLMTGSEDSQWVSLSGVVRSQSVERNTTALTLSTGDALINIIVPSAGEQGFPRNYVDARVEVQGVCATVFDNLRRLQGVRLYVPDWNQILVEEAAPDDAFPPPLRPISELFQFHAASSDLHRSRVRGVVVLRQADGSFFLQDATGGILIQPLKNNPMVAVGEAVELAGFPSLLNKLPVLQEAVVKQVSAGAPLKAVQLSPDLPLKEGFHGTLVRLKGRVIGHTTSTASEWLTLQFGQWITDAVLEKEQTEDQLAGILPGSVVKLEGVYAAGLDDNRRLQSFQLLLRSPSDITVLARPSWWTVRHTLAVTGVMAVTIFVAVIWISQLRRQVEKRSAQLAVEIQRRELTERQRELEKERTRIARDLHDDLGAALTQIRFLSALEGRDVQVPESTRGRMGQISEKSCEMVTSLDEIVWAVNPTNDSVPSLANYLCHLAEEFFQHTPIRCRLDVDDFLPPAPLTSEERHNIYLAVREALNNIGKHSQAAEVWLRIHLRQSELQIFIEDNGQGFSLPAAASSGEGLANMRQRLEKIGGYFEINTQPGRGTVYQFRLPIEMVAAREEVEPVLET